MHNRYSSKRRETSSVAFSPTQLHVLRQKVLEGLVLLLGLLQGQILVSLQVNDMQLRVRHTQVLCRQAMHELN
jgi:hypothetical protein